MKRAILIFSLLFAGLGIFAQENNGTVYSKHPAIATTKKLWAAFEKGDKAAFSSFLSDSMVINFNGGETNLKTAEYIESIDWWVNSFDDLKVADDSPAFPDAIDYTRGGLWVQDWLLITGTHKKSGINLSLHTHNLYSFNKAGKIVFMAMYFNNAQFEAINTSEMTQENGKIYINHPYIITVRKLVNAYCAKNLAAMTDFYSPAASFSNSTMKWGDNISLEKQKKELEKEFSETDNIRMKQIGYPDCIYYAREDAYTVYSWWIWTGTSKASGKKMEVPVMITHNFNKEGKIVSEHLFYSSNHLE